MPDPAEIESYLILMNVAKDSNFGFLIRTANAFGARIIICGRTKFSRMGATARTRRTPFLRISRLADAIDYVRERGCRVLGIEIGRDATSIWSNPYQGSTAFVLGNEGTGLTDSQIAACDQLVYIPQYGGAVSLNINVAGGIVLSHFGQWAGFRETEICGRQFVHSEDPRITVFKEKTGKIRRDPACEQDSDPD